MANDTQAKNNTSKNVPGGSMRLADRVKKMRDGINLHIYSEYSEEAGEKVEVSEAEVGGRVIGRYVKKGDKVLETSAAPDAQSAGIHAAAAKAAGIKEKDITQTAASSAAEQSEEDSGAVADGPADLGQTSKRQAATPDKAEKTTDADLTPGDSKQVKGDHTVKTGKADGSLFSPKGPKSPEEGKFSPEKVTTPKTPTQKGESGAKADKSNSKMANIENNTEGGPDLTKSYEIDAKPGEIKYTKRTPAAHEAAAVKPEEPKWKARWKNTSTADKQAFRSKLAAQRANKGMVKSSDPFAGIELLRKLRKACQMHMKPLDKADDGEGSAGYKALVARMKKPSQKRPGSSDEKIAAALSSQGKAGSPYATDRDDVQAPQGKSTYDKLKRMQDAVRAKSGPAEHEWEPSVNDHTLLDQDDDDEFDMEPSAAAPKTKPILLKEMKRLKQHTASGRPYQVMMGTDDSHKGLAGSHHVLEKPMTVQDVHAALRQPTSPLSRRVLDSVDSGHDTLFIHQPESTPGKQVGGLKVVKSMQKSSMTRAGAPKKHSGRTGALLNAVKQMVSKQMKKNAVAGYPEQGAAPMAPMAMSKAEPPKDHAAHAEAAAQDVRQMLHEKKGAAAEGKQVEAHMMRGKSPASAPKHSDKIRSVADAYAKTKGITLNHDAKHAHDPAHATKIAQAYEAMPHTPNDPATKQAYDALIGETADQYRHLKASGMKFSKITPGQANPYANGSKDVFKDVHENNHLWYYPTEQGFGSGDEHSDHPLLQHVDLGGETLPANDLFRMVHDVFGHAKEGHSFSARGEESAWRDHSQMFSPLAQKALTSETRGQNSWVNFGPHGEHNRANPAQTKYAEQKAGLLPDWAHK